jgi:hypothetical protein
VAADHPIFAPFKSPDFGDLGDVHVFQNFVITSKRCVPLVFSEKGDALLFEGQSTKGRLLVTTFGFDRVQTDWPIQVTFVPFLDLVLQYARGVKTMQDAFEPGEATVLDVPADKVVHEVRISSGNKVLARATVDGAHHAQFRAPAQPGLYDVTYDNDTTVQNVLAVNPPAKESELKFSTDPAALTAWVLPNSKPAAAPVLPAKSVSSALEQRLWWWALLAGAAALAADVLWSSSNSLRFLRKSG